MSDSLSEWLGMMIGGIEYRCGRRLPDPDCKAPLYSLMFNRRCGWLAIAMDDEYHGRPFRAPMDDKP